MYLPTVRYCVQKHTTKSQLKSQLKRTKQSPNCLDKKSNKEERGRPENQAGPEDKVGPENKVGPKNQVGPNNKVRPAGRGISWGLHQKGT